MTKAKDPAGCVGGMHEICVGVPDLLESVAYFQAFGCQIERVGHLEAGAAGALYGVDSALRSVRLRHGSADHGLIRLMHWDRPRNEGLGQTEDLRGFGSRWGVRGTLNLNRILNHAERARESGMPVTILAPILAVVGEASGHHRSRPFVDPIVGIREMVLLQPYYRQVLFERFGYESPLYGAIEPNCLLQTTQHTHAGIMIANDDHHVLDFYDKVLGLQRWMDEHVAWERAAGRRVSFGLDEGEDIRIVDFDDPRSGRTLDARRSGKLKCILVSGRARIDNQLDRSRAGSLGYSLYAWRVADIDAMHARVSSEGARQVRDVLVDEFGRRAFTFDAPDGYQWELLQA